LAALAVLLALVALNVVTARSAFAIVTCTLNPTTHIAKADVSADSFGVTVTRSSTNITVGGTSCGSVTMVDRVDIDMNHAILGPMFDLTNGPLGPGFTPETNGSEIEFVLSDLALGSTVYVTGTPGPDHFTAGLGFFQGIPLGERINLNVSLDGASPDADVVIPSLTVPIDIKAGGEHDIVSGQGTGGLNTGPLTGTLIVYDGPGPDDVEGGNGSDQFVQANTPDIGDEFVGKGGTDTMVYPGSFAVTLTQDGLANDGVPPNEHDNVGGDIERIVTGPGGDTVVGGPGAQFIDAGSGGNSVSGGPGNDILAAGTGADTFHGGKGRDLVSYASRQDSVDVTFDGSANDGAQAEGDNVLADMEGVVGSHKADQLTGGPRANWLYGNEGDDVVVGGGGNDHFFGSGPEALVGVFFQDGSDVFFGGPGKDTVDESNHPGDMTLSLDGAKNDQVTGHPEQGVDNIHTDVENVVGGADDDQITGSNAANRLTGGAGTDTLTSLGGPDTLLPGPGADTVAGGAGPDTASFAGASAAITANLAQGTATGDGDDVLSSVERLAGSAHADHLTGSGLPNLVSGGPGDDVLKGLGGSDVLKGGPGGDDFNGGPGTDTCKQGPGTGSKTSCEH